MPCPNCDSTMFGVADIPDEGVVRACAECGYLEEASLSDVTMFLRDNAPLSPVGWAADGEREEGQHE